MKNFLLKLFTVSLVISAGFSTFLQGVEQQILDVQATRQALVQNVETLGGQIDGLIGEIQIQQEQIRNQSEVIRHVTRNLIALRQLLWNEDVVSLHANHTYQGILGDHARAINELLDTMNHVNDVNNPPPQYIEMINTLREKYK